MHVQLSSNSFTAVLQSNSEHISLQPLRVEILHAAVMAHQTFVLRLGPWFQKIISYSGCWHHLHHTCSCITQTSQRYLLIVHLLTCSFFRKKYLHRLIFSCLCTLSCHVTGNLCMCVMCSGLPTGLLSGGIRGQHRQRPALPHQQTHAARWQDVQRQVELYFQYQLNLNSIPNDNNMKFFFLVSLRSSQDSTWTDFL